MLTKSQLVESIKDLPEELDREDIIERIIILEKYNRGIREINEGKLTSIEKVKEEMNLWRMSN